MSRGRFTEEEQEILKGSKHVIRVTDKAIYYTNEFKLLFIKEYLGGKKPAQIFQDAGFDLKCSAANGSRELPQGGRNRIKAGRWAHDTICREIPGKRFRRKRRNHRTMIIRGHWSNAAICRRT